MNLVNKKKKKKKKMFARERTAALQVAALSKSLASLSEGRRRALLNLIDETVLVEDYSSVFSANFPPSPPPLRNREKGRFVADSSYPFVSHSRCTFHGTLAERQRKRGRQLQAATNVRQFRSVARDTPRERSTFREFQSARARSFRRKRSKRLAVKFNPPLLGFTIDLSKESSVGRGTLSNPAIDSDNIIRCVEHFLRVDCFVWCNNIYIYIDRCSFLFSRRIELGRIQLKLIVSN